MKYLKHLARVFVLTSLLLGCGGGSSSSGVTAASFVLSNTTARCASWSYSGSKVIVSGQVTNNSGVLAGVTIQFVGKASDGSVILTDSFNFPFLAGYSQNESYYISPGTSRYFSETILSYSPYSVICSPMKSHTMNIVGTILRPEPDDDDDDDD